MPHQAAPYRRDEVPSTMTGETSPTRDATRPPKGRYRWVICALLFFATTINYVDRGVLGVLAPDLAEGDRLDRHPVRRHQCGLLARLRHRVPRAGPVHRPGRHARRVRRRAGRLVAGRRGACPGAVGVRVRGRPLLPGARRGGELPGRHQDHRRMVPPPRAGAGHRRSSTPARTSAPCWPRCSSRSSPCGAAGRRPSSFTGLIGLLWVAFWLPLYADPSGTRASPRRSWPGSRSDPPEPAADDPLAARSCRTGRRGPFAAGKFLTDPIWWFYLFWSAKFLSDRFGVDLKTDRPAADHDLPDGRRRLGRRRLAVVLAAPARLDGQRGPEDGAVWPARCASSRSRPPRWSRSMWAAVGLIGAGRGGAPGVLREPVHARPRTCSPAGPSAR